MFRRASLVAPLPSRLTLVRTTGPRFEPLPLLTSAPSVRRGYYSMDTDASRYHVWKRDINGDVMCVATYTTKREASLHQESEQSSRPRARFWISREGEQPPCGEFEFHHPTLPPRNVA